MDCLEEMSTMRRLVFVVFAILLSACAKGATAPSAGLTESVLVGPLLIHVGDTANVSVALFNAGDQPLAYNSSFCGQPFHVSDAFGNQVVPYPSGGCLFNTEPVTLQPGDQYVFQGRWVADSMLSGLDNPSRIPLAPGVYTVLGDITGDLGTPVQNHATTVHVTK
jgi:ABC-type transport system involved in multi-copper enzyme maturation permease subunit